MMDGIFGSLGREGVVVYQDDILISSISIDAHIEALKSVQARMKLFNLQINLAKCVFCASEVTFLGHELSAAGIEPIHSKVEAMAEAPTPTNGKLLHAFLGLSNYYNKFIPGLAQRTIPLYQLLKKSPADWLWTVEHQEIVDNIKTDLMSHPILRIYDEEAETFLLTAPVNKRTLYLYSRDGSRQFA